MTGIRWRLALLFVTGFAPLCVAEEKLTFNRDIRPLLSDKCFACHGTDAKHREAGLRLDQPEGAFRDKDGVIPIKPGNLEKSDAWIRINSSDKDEMMPPSKSHKTLSNEEKATIRKWIEQGASYQKHWSFEPQVKAAVPQPPAGANVRNVLDAFIVNRLKRENLPQQPEADKETLIRRVTFALTGLPPAIDEVEAYLADPSPNAYEKVVDRLLASPKYGEQMARHWLDLARYGDTHGLHLDNERQTWLYRDWVVGAFNRNMPFNEFTIEQIAGDLLPNATIDQTVATGFNRCNVTTAEGGAIDAEFRFRYAVDRTATTMQAWMGLTAGCAVCHDHKFDPISQKEFYQLYAFFNSAADPGLDGNALLTAPVIKVETGDQKRRMAELDQKRVVVEKQLQAKIAALPYADPANVVPMPPPVEKDTMLIDDDFPRGAQVKSDPAGRPTVWVSEDGGEVASGKRALRISGKSMAQNYYDGGVPPIEVPPGARFKLKVFIDPVDPPKAVMIQFHTSDWLHRAMWGDDKAIPGFGTPNTTQRFVAGPLPEASRWIELEVPGEKIGLKPGDKITGVAFTLDGGTATFDALSVISRVDDASDPAKSLIAWIKPREGKETQGLPGEINNILKSVAAGARTVEQQKQLRDYYLANACSTTKPVVSPFQDEIAKLKKERDDLEKGIPSTFVMKDTDKQRDSFVMQRGAYDKPGDKVSRGVPAAFPPLPNPENPNRLDLAKWIVADGNPLTARVTVNRLWQQFFGVGLVKTSGDFGSQGQPPSHPELLDWMAVSFRESGWDVKKLVRFFVTSATFRQSSVAPAALWQRDPDNRLLARGPRFRFDAEELRDNALAVSGLLDTTMGGKGVRPYQPPNVWEPLAYIDSNTRNYKRDTGAALYRRSLYTFLKRTAPPPFMANFDAPSREQICNLRERSDTPLQALQLMNDEQHIEAARAFAERIMSKGGTTPEERIAFAYRTVLARKPAPDEIAIVRAALDEHLAAYRQAPEAAAKFIRQGESKPTAGLPEPELAAWTLVANLVLNLDETLTRN
jgi:hypothetical protein